MIDASGSHSAKDVLGRIHQEVKREYEQNRRILSFEEYLGLLAENPERQLRGSAQMLADMMDHFGKREVHQPIGQENAGRKTYRFNLFDHPIEGITPKLVGHEDVQTSIYQTLRSFGKQGINTRLILLHGPNGSAKTTIAHALMGGLERYSRVPEGAAYSFNWIFPVERGVKGAMGIQGNYARNTETGDSYAHLPEDQIGVVIPNELKDHPFLLIPKEHRLQLLIKLCGESRAKKVYSILPVYLREGDLSHRSKMIYEALLASNNGDYQKVLSYVQVERIYSARRYRQSLVTVEPQMHVDAQYMQISYNKNLSALPAALQGLNLFALGGDLVDGNRGLIEYSDILKRPIDSYKYLLGACETGSVNVGHSIAYLDTVYLGTANELQLDAFKEFPDFGSFKARIELIRVPYLLSVSQEKEIYDSFLHQIAGEKEVTPHTSSVMATWTVLTRLKKPNSIHYPPPINSLMAQLSPLEKAKLYDRGEMPSRASAEERKILRAQYARIREEYSNIPYYEGRTGASVREVKTIFFDAAHNSEQLCLSPLSVFLELEKFVKKVSEYDFLKQDVKDGYHDSAEFIKIARNEYLNVIDREVRECIGLYDSTQWESFIKKYVLQVSHVIKKEKVRNAFTGKSEDPDLSLILEFETIVKAPKDPKELEGFRQNIISQIGVWSLDHKDEPVAYSQVFPEFLKALEAHYYESQKTVLTKMHKALIEYDKDPARSGQVSDMEGLTLARQTIENMKSRLGYSDTSAKEVISFLMKHRY